MIEVTGLTKRYKNFTAVDNISFIVDKGEIFGFLGPNGAGKTTTIRLLTGQLYPSGGTAKVCGYDIVKDRGELKKNIGVVFEQPNLYTRLTARFNLEVFRKLYRMPPKRVEEVLNLVGLAHRADEPVKNYSRGMKQRLLIARALLHRPGVLFLDEPTSGLDPHAAKQIRGLIKELSSEGITVFLTTHYLKEAEMLCDRISIIDNSKIIAAGKTGDLKNLYSSQEINIKIEEEGEHKNLTLHLNEKEALNKVIDYWKNKKIISIHSVEPTLEEVFLSITGSGKNN